MLIAERQRRLLAILRERRAAQLDELAQTLDVSGSTIRRDLEALERQGHVQRTHGGAIVRDAASVPGQPSPALAARMNQNVAAKQAVGRWAAAQIEPNMTVLLDGGSTVVYTARQIVARPLQVVTNSLSIANHFADDEQVELLLIGGSLYPRSGVLVGPIATGCLADLHADLLLFSLAGIYDDAAYNINLTMSQVEQVMMHQAARSMLLMDSSKFDRKSLVRVCGLGEVDTIVTDAGIKAEWRNRLGDRLVVADAPHGNGRL